MKEKDLKQLLDGLPASPGVYLMRGNQGKIVYVGKAINLRARVRQYFTPGTTDPRHFVRNLRQKLTSIEVVLTTSEKEALLLEYNLIKRHSPRYNLRLMDDKNFLCLKLDLDDEWPTLEMIRKPKRDDAIYYGPFPSARSARETLKVINRYFRLRSCSRRAFANRVRPCLQHQIHRCQGPCVLEVNHDEYMEQLRYVRLFMEGKKDDLIEQLRDRMAAAADEMAYERAVMYRDQIAAVEQTLAPQRITDFKDIDQDLVGFYREGDQVQVAVLEVLRGRLAEKRDFFFKGLEFPDHEIISSFLVQRYTHAMRIPHEVIVSRPLPDTAALSELLTEQRGGVVRVIHPRRGARTDQIKMADLNARQEFETHTRDREDIRERLETVQKKLRLAAIPERIECVDIAHLGGRDTVGALSAVINGKIDVKAGRIFRLKIAAGGDDYRAMGEVLTRRFARAAKSEQGWEAPDLLVVDGGRGQLSIARTVLEELGLPEQEVVALAKDQDGSGETTGDRLFLVGRKNPIPLRAQTSSLHLLAMARDEAHRLANRYQRKIRSKRTLRSALDDIPGVGPKTRRALLKAFRSVKGVRGASVEELVQVKGVGIGLAKIIADTLSHQDM